ncbi:FecCD family ABC transporter permease [Amycolatopsis suaedae]|uniref:Iron-enterobactin ABC transporter permease n=1 Tax=Amycolatopsis suaedae TaxID=2510978 RepID=A0A4Q7J816_9PSEU|nr:iron chelate uptake ABC transporter family permease subunit [Amycolatopsis suaedae]RZQ63349.1 iron-enterobactin ABC transporter permease [Amycolatopsis suaedae]
MITTVDRRRAVVAGAATLGVALACGIALLGIGSIALGPGEVIGALLGLGDRAATTVVVEWRLPRVLAALTLGAALGVSGAICQSLTRNPLGSPDIIGFTSGSHTGALVTMLVVGTGYTHVALGALAGGVATAIAVYLLAWSRGVQGFRLIIVGIGVTAMLGSVNTWLLLTADVEVAMSASTWATGSLNGVAWPDAGVAAAVALALVALSAMIFQPMRQLELGDELAATSGLNTERTRLGLLTLSVALTATATAVAGPINFIALAAPQIARRLVRGSGTTLLPSACVGALLLIVSDGVAQWLFHPVLLPVGVVTVVVGGAYLVWLLVRGARRTS